MNQARRKAIAATADALDTQLSEVRDAAEQEQEAFDNLSENLQAGEKGQAMEAAAEELGGIADELEELIGRLRAVGEEN